MTQHRRLTQHILIGMLLGAAVGYLCHAALTPERATATAGLLSIITDVFLRLIKMIIAPLVFATLVSGIAHMKDGGALGRIGTRTMLWFVGAGLASLTLGLVLVQVLQPGAGLGLVPAASAAPPAMSGTAFDLRTFVVHLVPRSIFEAMATNEILQIVVFSVLAGVALIALGERGQPLLRAADALVHLMLRITDYVMRAAPVAVSAAIAAVIATQGLGILVTFGKFIGSFYVSLIVLWALLIGGGYAVLGRSIVPLIRTIQAPVLLAFATASSEAAYPRTLEQLERVGIPKRIASFVLPLGYSFNLDGSMMYCAFALMFIAQAYGIQITFAEQITMLLLLMVMSKGMAGVPRASLVVIAAALPHFDLPEAGLLLIMGVDQFLDMGRTATNVVGNSVATAVVARWEDTARTEPCSAV